MRIGARQSYRFGSGARIGKSGSLGRKPSAHLESLAIDHVLDNAVADDRAAEHLLGSDIHALIGEAVYVHAACQERQEE